MLKYACGISIPLPRISHWMLFIFLRSIDGVVEDVARHLRHEYLFGSVGDDQHLLIRVLHSPTANNPIQSVFALQAMTVNYHHKNAKKSFSETIKEMYNHVDKKSGQKASLVANDIYKIVMKNATSLDNEIICDRDFDYDYFGLKTLERSSLNFFWKGLSSCRRELLLGSRPSSTSGDLLENKCHLECSELEICYSISEQMNDDKNAVNIYPDYVTYRGTLFIECRFTFSSDCISIKCSDAGGSDEKFIRECDITDIIHVGCQWSRSVEALLLKFWIKTNVGQDVENFLASVTDMYWLEKEQKIKSLVETYEHIWGTIHDDNYALDDVTSTPHNSFSKLYFTKILEPF